MFAWNGKVLRVDLSRESLEEEILDDGFRMAYLGGRGINSRFLFDEVSPGVNPLSPANVLIIGAGALNSLLPGMSRYTITSKSPLTGILGDSNAGSRFGVELKRTGYDHIIVKGKAEKPVYLWIDGSHVEIRDARNIWGKSTSEAADTIRSELGDKKVEVISIGQAGENLVRFACVLNGRSNANGRTGMGAVMGSKNLKAIAVRGRESFELAYPEKLRVWVKELREKVRSSPIYPLRSRYGTLIMVKGQDAMGVLGSRNLSEVKAEGNKNISHEAFEDRLTKIGGCPGCFIPCKIETQILEGPYKGEKGGMVEFASTAGFGANCGNYDPDSILKLTYLCNEYGLDVTECGYILGYVMDWYEHGLITNEDMDGVELTWGNWVGMIEMVHRIAKREGFGDILAEGPLRAASRIGKGAEKSVSHSKGLTRGGSPDTRPFKGLALNLATSTRGADHLRGLPWIERLAMGWVSEETKQRIREKFGTEEVMFATSYNKAGVVAYYQDIATIADSLGLCKFYADLGGGTMSLKEMAELFYLATGLDINEQSLRGIANRIYNVERAFLVREGITKKDDYLSGKYVSESTPGGPFAGETLDENKFTKMLEEYYSLRGWDRSTGIPTRSTLEEYGLKDVALELEKYT